MSELFKLGNHFIIEFSGCNQELLFDNEYVRSKFVQSARESRLSIVGEGGFTFNPHGFTYYLLLAESHASIHVWPEYAYCAVDLFTCNLELDGDHFVSSLKEALGAQTVATELIERGCPVKSWPEHPMTFQQYEESHPPHSDAA